MTTMTKPDRSPGQQYTLEQRAAGLQMLALCDGNHRLAHRELKARGLTIPASTLRSWMVRTYADEYREIQAREMPEIRARMADRTQVIAGELLDAMGEAVQIFRDKDKTEMTALEASKAAQSFSIPYGVTSEKTLLWRGEATQIHEHRNVDEDVAALKRMGIDVRESTAVELETGDE